MTKYYQISYLGRKSRKTGVRRVMNTLFYPYKNQDKSKGLSGAKQHATWMQRELSGHSLVAEIVIRLILSEKGKVKSSMKSYKEISSTKKTQWMDV